MVVPVSTPASSRTPGRSSGANVPATPGTSNRCSGPPDGSQPRAGSSARGWLPSGGPLPRFVVPGVAGTFAPLDRPGVRLDAGVETGTTIGTHYDPLLAKLVAWAPTRTEAARALAGALARARIHGPATNRDLLVRVLRDGDFLAGDTDTGFLDRHPESFAPLLSIVDSSARAAALASAAARRGPFPPGWRNVPAHPQVVEYAGGIRVEYHGRDARDATPDRVVLDVDGVRQTYEVHRVGEVSYVDGPDGAVALIELPRFPPPETGAAQGSLTAPLPGGGGRAGPQVRPRVLHREGEVRRPHQRAVGRGGQAGLPRRQPAGRVRRRRRRPDRAGDRRRGAGRRRLPAAADRRLPRHRRYGHRPPRHRGAAPRLPARHRRLAPARRQVLHLRRRQRGLLAGRRA